MAQASSCEFCETSGKAFSYRTPLVAASELKILILSSELEYLYELEWTRRKAKDNNYSLEFCKQTINKLLLAYSLQKMVFVDQTLKHVLLINFYRILINSSRYFLFKLDFSMDINKYLPKRQKQQRKDKEKYIITCLRCWCRRVDVFLMQN